MKLPALFLNSIKNAKGFDESSFVNTHESGEKITSIRMNPFKKSSLDFETNNRVDWCETGFYLNERPSFTFDPLFHAGSYYVQEAGSMFLEFALKNTVDLKQSIAVLDLCAAPGGKSTLINSLINDDSFLISNEVIKNRADVLAYNLSKWGTCNTAVTNCDPSVIGKLENVFDVVVADVPCSGSGLFRKQPEAINEWSLDNVNLCSTRQKRIIADSITCLKQGGTLIYSTCSYSTEEDEAIVEWMINEFDLEYISLPIDKEWKIIESPLGYRFYPNRVKSEGFFCAVLRKKGDSYFSHHKTKKNLFEQASKKELTELQNQFEYHDFHTVFKFQSNFKLVNTALYNFLNAFGSHLYFKKTGTTLGEFKHRDFLPDHELALSLYTNKNSPKIELNREQAIAFLKKENLQLEAQKGIQLMCYKNLGLGWAKILDKRVNNYLPKEFRILSSEEN
ncbi:MAG TPA: RNA methyltransferase [Bacteroidia bacterium]|nr:RNA methyltransferase [Bacteroidia bacterium]